MKMSVTQDGPKWTTSRVELWRVLEGEGEETMANTPNGPNGTVWSVARWKDRG